MYEEEIRTREELALKARTWPGYTDTDIPVVWTFPNGEAVIEFSTSQKALKSINTHRTFELNGKLVETQSVASYHGVAVNFMLLSNMTTRQFNDMHLQVLQKYGTPEEANTNDPYGPGHHVQCWWNSCKHGWEEHGYEGDTDGCMVEPDFAVNMVDCKDAKNRIRTAIHCIVGNSRSYTGPKHGDQL